MAEVKLVNVGKVYVSKERGGAFAALSDFSLEIADHEFVTLSGPSECGKTTLLRLIVGLEFPDSGEIRIAGREAKRFSRNPFRTGMVFRSGSLYPHFTVYRNLLFPLKHLQLSREEKDLRVREAAKMFRAEKLLQKKPKELTREERMRAAIARAIVSSPDVVVMDEPLAMLDEQERAKLRIDLERLREQRRLTVIYAAYDLSEAMALGDRVVLMEDGRIERVRSPQELLQEGGLRREE